MPMSTTPPEPTRGPQQAVVDQHREVADERATIQEADRRERMAAHEQAAHEPSVQFWQTRSGNLGAILALLAGLFTLGVRVWPVAPPQSHGPLGTAWAVGAVVVAAMYLLGFWLADRRQALARALLIAGALIQIGGGLLAGGLVDAQGAAPAPLAMLFDVVPAVMALVAGFVIGSRTTRREIDRETGRR